MDRNVINQQTNLFLVAHFIAGLWRFKHLRVSELLAQLSVWGIDLKTSITIALQYKLDEISK